MTGDCHVRFCERLRGETPLCLLGERKKELRAKTQRRKGPATADRFFLPYWVPMQRSEIGKPCMYGGSNQKGT
jgi:hypothetical protein